MAISKKSSQSTAGHHSQILANAQQALRLGARAGIMIFGYQSQSRRKVQ